MAAYPLRASIFGMATRALGIDVGRRVHQGEGVLLAEREDRDR
jgi:hypothetical protein